MSMEETQTPRQEGVETPVQPPSEGAGEVSAEIPNECAAEAVFNEGELPGNPMYSSTLPEDGGPIAQPPPQVMTALGPMPLPAEIRRRIPEKFVAKPIIEEREIYIAKKEVQERTIEVPHVHYEHKFAEVSKALKVKKIIPKVKEVVREVPREVYKPVIEEKVIEVPQGVKYVEVPVEVPCAYPPKIVPRPKVQVVERVVETIKPVVKEKVIEVPQTVVKQIPKIKTVEVPYYVPRYVEKIIEVPYQPPEPGSLPPLLTGTLPSHIVAQMPMQAQMGGQPMQSFQSMMSMEQGKDGVSQELQKGASLVSPDGSSPAIQLPPGFKWGQPSNAPKFPPSPFASAGAPRSCAPDGDPRMLNMPPLMVTCPPEVGRVDFGGYVAEPDILTRQGVMAYSGFKAKGNFQMLFPPLAPQPGVPMMGPPAAVPGTPDVRTIQEMQRIHAEGHGPQLEAWERRAREEEIKFEQMGGGLCGPPAPPKPEVVYEQ